MPAKRYRDEHLELPSLFIPGRIGVVTVLYNSETVLPDFFESLEQQTYTDFLVYCVDNASADRSVDRCRRRGPLYRVIENGKNLGVAAGNNIGIRAAIEEQCEFVLFLNNDVVFGPELLKRLVIGLHLHNCSMTTPLIFYYDKPKVVWAAGGYFQPWLGYRCLHRGQDSPHDDTSSRDTQVPFTPTCCVLVHRELFAEVGLMDERFFVYYDDTDFMLRAWKSGKQLFLLPAAQLWHKVSSLSGGNESAFSVRYLTRNHALYTHKNAAAPVAWLVSALYFCYFLKTWLAGKATRSEAIARIHHWQCGTQIARGIRA